MKEPQDHTTKRTLEPQAPTIMGNVGTLLQLLDFQSFNATTKVSDWRECCRYLEGEQGLSDGIGERDPAIVH